MERLLRESAIFRDADEGELSSFVAIAGKRSLSSGEYAFLLGDGLDDLFVVLSGKIDLCFPFSFGGDIRNVAVEAALPGEILGWSALVKPYRSTLSARADLTTEMAVFARRDLMGIFEANPKAGFRFTRRVAEIMGRRLHTFQALWAREFQNAVTAGLADAPGSSA